MRDKVVKIEEVAEEKTKLYEKTFHQYQGQLLGKYNELKSKMEDHFNSVFKKMQAETRKQFDDMQKKFARKEQELDAAFQRGKSSIDFKWIFHIWQQRTRVFYEQVVKTGMTIVHGK